MTTQEHIRKRVLKLFRAKGLIDSDAASDMLEWENSGFSLNANLRIEAHDREGLERLVRYCARPVFASERLDRALESLRYTLPQRLKVTGSPAKSQKDNASEELSPSLSPANQLPPQEPIRKSPKPASLYRWALLMARIYEINPLSCPKCTHPMRIIAFIQDRPTICKILNHIQEPSNPPPISPARGPPELEFNYDQTYEFA